MSDSVSPKGVEHLRKPLGTVRRQRVRLIVVVGIVAIALAGVLYRASLGWVPDAEARVRAAAASAGSGGTQAPDRPNPGSTERPPTPDRNDAAGQEKYARALADRGEFVAALLPAERAVHLAPTNASAHLTLAMVCATAGYPSDSLAHYRTAIKLDPNLLEGYQRLGDLQLSLGDTAGAEATYNSALAKAPSSSGPRLSLARLYHSRKQSDKVLSVLGPILSDPSAPIAALYLAGKACQATGKTVDAETYLRRDVKQQPDFADAWHALGSIHANEGRFTEGVTELKNAVALQPDNAVYIYALGNALRSDLSVAGNLREARNAFERAIELDPSLTVAHYYYGLMLEQTDEPEAALREYRETLRQSPKFLSAGYRMGIVYQSLGNIAASRKYMEQFGTSAKAEITEIHGHRRDDSFVDSADAHFHRAKEFLKSGDNAKAITELQSALERDPRHGLARRTLSELTGGSR
jgi:tetratricopeptide (TPR) repeat protein